MKTARLGDIALVFNGNSISAADKDKHYRGVVGMPYVGTAEVGFDTEINYDAGVAIPSAKLKAFKIAPSGTALVCAEGGSAGRKVGFLDREVCFGNKLFAIQTKVGWDGKFLFYFSQSEDFKDQFRALTTGLIGGVSVKKFKGIEVPEIPLNDQRRIVAVTDDAFAAIATATANTEKNLANARELFDDFLSATFDGTTNEWDVFTIGEVCTLRSGTTVRAELEQPAGEVPYLKVADMSHPENLDRVTTSSRFLRRNDVGRNALIPAGATIFPKRGGAIMTNKKRLVATPMAADLNIMSVIPGPRLTARFLNYYFQNVDMRLLGSGSSIPQINNYDIEPLKIAIPDEVTQVDFVAKADAVKSEIKKLAAIYSRKLERLSQLKQSLLHCAFTGELAAAMPETIAA